MRQTDVLTILPGTMPEPELARRLADTQGAVIMKLGRTFPAVLRALEAAGRESDALAWFHRTHAIDSDEITDAAARADLLERRQS